MLIEHFVQKTEGRFHKSVQQVNTAVSKELGQYTFPGNVRELENIIERAVALCEGTTLTLADLPADIHGLKTLTISPNPQSHEAIKDAEMDLIAKVYQDTGFNQSETARRLGISRTTLWRRLRNYSLQHAPKK